MTYRAELDGIRAIAVAAVILAHAGVPLSGGHLGVDIFFVLSGYLITQLIMRDIAAGRFSLRTFYARRARRLLPALIVMCLVCVPMAWVYMPPDDLARFGQSLVALGFFATNFFFWQQGGYFAPSAEETALIHTWSLAVEEQFYLLFPLCLLALATLRRGAAATAIAVAAIASLLGMILCLQIDRDAAFYLLPFRAWELLAGALVALHQPQTKPRARSWIAQLGLSLVLLGVLAGAPQGTQAAICQLAVVLGTVMLVTGASPANRVGRLLARPPLTWLGLVSYSAYLWHQPIFAFARLARVDAPGLLQMAGLTALTLALAGLSWRYVEQPCRHMKWPLARRSIAAALCTALIAAGAALHLGQGFGPQRFDSEQMALFETALPSPLRESCHGHAGGAAEGCVYFVDVPPSWVVLGDSHGVEIAHELAMALKPRGESLLHLSASACPPATQPDAQNPACARWLERALARIQRDDSLKTVVLAFRHSVYLGGEETRPDESAATFNLGTRGTVQSRRLRYLQDLRGLIDRLRGLGHHVLVLAPVPQLERDVRRYSTVAAGGEKDLPALSRSAYDLQNSFVLSRLADLPAKVILPARALCSEDRCFAAIAGEAMYFDDDHLSLSGARRVVQLILKQSERARGSGVPALSSRSP